MRLLAALLLLCLAAAAPADIGDFAYAQRLGAAVPATAQFQDETGRTLPLLSLLGDRPGILALGYFHCPNLCGVLRADLFRALGEAGIDAAAGARVIALSIDPAETGADAAAAKRDDATQFPAARDAVYLTGDAAAVRAVAEAVGFQSRFDPASKEFLHPAGLVVLTPAGAVSGYLLGVGYAGPDLREAVERAREGRLAAAVRPVLLLCFHYDPATGRYTLAIVRLLEIGAAATVLAIGGAMALAFCRERRVKRRLGTVAGEGGRHGPA